MRSRWRRNLALLLLACLLLAAWAAYGLSRHDHGPPEGFVRVQRGSVRHVIEERGYTALKRTHRVTAQIRGLFYPEPLKPGDRVSRGQSLGRIDPERVALEVDMARARLARAEATLKAAAFEGLEETLLAQARALIVSMDHTVAAAEAQVSSARSRFAYRRDFLQRVKRLYEQQAISEDELHRAQVGATDAEVELRQAEVVALALKAVREAVAVLPRTIAARLRLKRLERAVAEAEQRAAVAALKLAELKRSRSLLRAPIDGIVLDYPVRSPRAVAPGTLIAAIGQPEELEIVTELLSTDAVRLPPSCSVELLWEPDGELIGTTSVDRIEPLGFTKVSSLGVEQQRVKVHIGLPAHLRDRLTGRVPLPVGYELWLRFVLAAKDGVLAVPRSAVYRDEQGQMRVVLWRNGRAVEQPVEVGIVGDERVEIRSGLHENDVVAILPDQVQEPQ